MNMFRVILGAVLLTAGLAGPAAATEEKCLATRISAKAKYESCVAKVMAAIQAGAPVDDVAQGKLSKCRMKYASVWPKLSALEGSATCSGKPRFTDDGLQSVHDNLTGLTWNKQGGATNPLDKDLILTWSDGSPYTSDGTLFDSTFLANINGAQLDGYGDWRIPTVAELLTLIDEPYPCTTSPCVDPAFNYSCDEVCYPSGCNCTQPYTYWTGIEVSPGSNLAWYVHFGTGAIGSGFKTLSRNARAVSGGL